MEKIKVNELAYELVDFMKDNDYYEFKDIYQDDEDAYQDMLRSLDPKTIHTTIEWLSNNIVCLAQEKDMSDPIVKRITDKSYEMIYKVNQYSMQLDKDMEL